jgi:hypothetical protein
VIEREDESRHQRGERCCSDSLRLEEGICKTWKAGYSRNWKSQGNIFFEPPEVT